ncbi:superoxide dismutase [Oecophyllibacter saccharovorans]|uniref:Superoxide dismutase n=1 Tax=Oecophyllibacter saccharovorans TaxID=2558360 RepID=A0A506UQ29_9PROT|nr:superoxide dismutase [Oecophyllibacter saccharovorans]QDH15655.1 superoxide dismutase [Oecophyllibacter saccharovorans]TPW35430.1 superoxide dismutase [Oecophyllibacter saccharovorans]
MAFELPPLPYPDTSLNDKGMSKETLDLHHGKHHRGYVNTLNGLVEKDPALQGKSLEELITLSTGKPDMAPVFNNAGQHYNHSMFWKSLSPNGGKIPPKLEKKIIEDFGSVEAFKDAFRKAATSQFGSGWAWLVLTPEGKLAITKTPNAASPLSEKQGKPLLTSDVWEHAYYLDFHNRRPDFITNFLDNLANYEFAEAEMLAG